MMKLAFQLSHRMSSAMIEKLGHALLETGIYSAVELEYPFHTVGNSDAKIQDYKQAIRTLINRYAPRVSLHIPTNLDCGAGNAVVRRAVIEEMKKSIAFAAEFNARVLSVHGATIGNFDYPEFADTPVKEFLQEVYLRKKHSALQATIDMLGETGLYAGQYGCAVALENVLLKQEVIHTPEDLLYVLREVKLDNVGALYDCGHANRIGYDNAKFIRELGERLIHVHMNDNDGTCDLHGQIGTGTVDFRGIFTELKNLHYADTVLVEVMAKNAEDLLENARQLRQYM